MALETLSSLKIEVSYVSSKRETQWTPGKHSRSVTKSTLCRNGFDE